MKRINIPSSDESNSIQYYGTNYSSNISLYAFFYNEMNDIKNLFDDISKMLNDSSTSGGEST